MRYVRYCRRVHRKILQAAVSHRVQLIKLWSVSPGESKIGLARQNQVVIVNITYITKENKKKKKMTRIALFTSTLAFVAVCACAYMHDGRRCSKNSLIRELSPSRAQTHRSHRKINGDGAKDELV